MPILRKRRKVIRLPYTNDGMHKARKLKKRGWQEVKY